MATDREAAARVWRGLVEFAMEHIGNRMGMLQEFGLTPGHFKALQVLEAGEPRTMGSCAEALACDASTVTWLIDRLEERKLVKRRPSAVDRRVKSVVLTPLGIEVKKKISKKFYEPPAALLALDGKTLARLEAYVDALGRGSEAFEHPSAAVARATERADRAAERAAARAARAVDAAGRRSERKVRSAG